jgi:hypothetical protein
VEFDEKNNCAADEFVGWRWSSQVDRVRDYEDSSTRSGAKGHGPLFRLNWKMRKEAAILSAETATAF